MGTYIVGITGASGSIYGKKLIERLLALGHNVELCLTDAAYLVTKSELGWNVSQDMTEAEVQEELNIIFKHKEQLIVHKNNNVGDSIASGSYPVDGMIVIPCSMGTVSAIATGASNNLLERAADVTLKEDRRLVLVPREAPLNTIHLKNLYELSTYGVKIVPASPSFYHNPETMDELLDYFVERILSQLGVDSQHAHWIGVEKQMKK